MSASSTHGQHVSLTAAVARQECDIASTTCSDVAEYEARLPASTLTSPSPSQAPACGAAGSQNEAILIPTDSESESMSESDGETDDDVLSPKKINEGINRETITQSISASPVESASSTIETVPETPRALALGSAGDDQLNAPVQRSSSPTFLTTLVPPIQQRRDEVEVDPSRRSPGKFSAEIAEQDHGQTEDASEPLSSYDKNHEPVVPAELPQRTQPNASTSQNNSASIDGDGKTAEDGDRDSRSDSSDDSDGGNDGDDEDYSDGGSSSDSEGENGGHRKKRKTDRSPSASNFDSPPNKNIEERAARLCKRRKAALDGANMPLPGPNYMPRSAGRLSRSPERPQTASLPSPPASNGLSEPESDKGPACSKASTASFGEWLLQNAALKCVTIDGVDTYQLQFQRAPMHSCSRRRERRSHTLVKKSKGGRKSRDETKGRRCGMCKQAGHNARTCQSGLETSNEENNV